MGDFSHLTDKGEAAMVDVSSKSPSGRQAVASGMVRISEDCLEALDELSTREIVSTARIAAIQAAKKTSEWIPLCHQVPLAGLYVDIHLDHGEHLFVIKATSKTRDVTGVEMEALTAASAAGLTIYDMIKAKDPAAHVGPFYLEEKTGGKSGPWTRGNHLGKDGP